MESAASSVPNKIDLKRLLFFVPARQIGGAEKHSAHLCEAFAAAGVEVTLVAPAAVVESATLRAVRARRITAEIAWDDAESPRDNVIRQQSAAVARLAGLEFDFAIVSLPWPIYGYGLHWLLSAVGLPHLLVSHLAPAAQPPYDLAPELRVAPEVYANGLATWVGVSAPVASRIQNLFALPGFTVGHIANGVDVRPLSDAQRRWRRSAARCRLDISETQKLVLVLGRLDKSKGSDLLPAIAEAIADLQALLVCVGSGPLQSFLEESEAGRKGLIRLVGQVPVVDDWLDAADVLFLPSRIEGSPLVFLEAAAVRCPVVASDSALEAHGDVAPQLALIAPSEDVANLGHALRLALDNPDLLKANIERAFDFASGYTRQDMTDSYMKTCRLALARYDFAQRKREVVARGNGDRLG
ncbi:MAG: glycosyltransferase family 4 protein [Alphaproteobacteria bacterium]|nr:glycosyltransferase family 4 protein [Alphaproteobacteria bacterium]